MILQKNFFNRNTLKVAQNLLGCVLVRKIKNKVIRAIITETEAYRGENDLASHASKGRTPRTELMYGEAGRAYIYLIYGMYHCLNIVTEKKDYPAAVLIRSIKIEGVDYQKTNGPGKVCRELKIEKKLNGWDMARGERLWIVSPRLVRPGQKKIIEADKRIGVDYAKHCKDYLWRFFIK